MDNNLNQYNGGPGSGNQNGNRPGGNNNQNGNGQPPKKQNLMLLLVLILHPVLTHKHSLSQLDLPLFSHLIFLFA